LVRRMLAGGFPRLRPLLRMRAVEAAAAAAAPFLRLASVAASDLKQGDVVEHDGTLLRVETFSISRQGQTKPYVQTSMRNVRTGSKKDLRLRVDDALEKAEVEVAKHLKVLYTEGGTVALMNPTTFEQMEISASLLGDRAPFVSEGMELQVESYKGAPLAVHTPEKTEALVADVAEPPAADRIEKGFNVEARLENGIRIKVPKFVKPGDSVVVSLVEGKVGTYIGKGERK